MFNTYIKDQNIFTENEPSALPRILLVNTILALMAGMVLWAVLQRNFDLNHQALAASVDQAQVVISTGLQVSNATIDSPTNLENLN